MRWSSSFVVVSAHIGYLWCSKITVPLKLLLSFILNFRWYWMPSIHVLILFFVKNRLQLIKMVHLWSRQSSGTWIDRYCILTCGKRRRSLIYAQWLKSPLLFLKYHWHHIWNGWEHLILLCRFFWLILFFVSFQVIKIYIAFLFLVFQSRYLHDFQQESPFLFLSFWVKPLITTTIVLIGL